MTNPQVSVVIPSKNRLDLLQQCVESIKQMCVWTGPDRSSGPTRQAFYYEIVVIDTGDGKAADWVEDTRDISRSAPAVLRRAVRLPGGTFAQACNMGVKVADGAQILLCNDDIIVQNDIIRALRLASHAPGCIIGARLLYPNGLIQHAGIGFDSDGGPYNLWNLAPGEHPEAMKPRSLPAVTFACAFMPKSVWQELGGLDEGYQNAYEDVDFCLRYREQGGLVLYDPTISAVHLEGQSEGRNAHVAESWQHFESIWTKTGRIHYVLGSWPFSVQRGG